MTLIILFCFVSRYQQLHLKMDSSNNDYVNINILFFAKAKELVKKSSMKLKLPSSFDTIDLLLEKIEEEIPQLKVLNRCFVFALNEEYLCDDTMDGQSPSTSNPTNPITLKNNDELAVIPPLSGG